MAEDLNKPDYKKLHEAALSKWTPEQQQAFKNQQYKELKQYLKTCDIGRKIIERKNNENNF